MSDSQNTFIYFEDARLEALLEDSKLKDAFGDDVGEVIVSFMNCVGEDVPYEEFVEVAHEEFESWEAADPMVLATHIADKLRFDESIEYEMRAL